jgi:transglutaminase-like putative cysteine protease
VATASVSYYNLDPEMIGPYNISSDLYNWNTQDTFWIECNHPLIRAQAKTLAAGETNPLLLAERNYRFVLDVMSYQSCQENKGALYALQKRAGDCTEYATLFVALCRAQGIPSRIVSGATISADNILHNHTWAELYLPNYGWIPVDPTWGQSTGQNYFGHLSERHVGFYYGLWNGFSHWYSPILGQVLVQEEFEPG